MADDRQTRWWWACAPDAPLGRLAADAVAGRLPAEALIRDGARRRVWRLPQVAGGVLVKRFTPRLPRPWPLPSQARSEYAAMEAFCRLGLPTVRPLGFAERRAGLVVREAWFVGRLVPEARTVAEALRAARAARDEARVLALAGAALATVRSLHEAPWHHRDLHADNLLLAPDGSVSVTDLHSARRVPRLTRAMRVENLSRLLFSMRASLDLDRAEVWELVAGYARARGEVPAILESRVRRGLLRFERDYLRGRCARCLRDSSGFVAERLSLGRVFRRRDHAAATLREDLREHEQRARRGAGSLLGDTPRGRVTLVPGGRVVKESRATGLAGAVRQALGRGRSRTAWLAARRLALIGISTPEALALVERPDGSALLVTRAVPGPLGLREWAAGLRGGRTGARAAWPRGAVALAVGTLVGRLARHGLRHDDLSTKNLLLTAAPAAPPADLRGAPDPRWPDVQLIDLDNLRVVRPFQPAAIVRMLGQLADVPPWITRTDRLRFLRGYERGAGRPLPPDVARAGLELAAARAARRAARAGPGTVRRDTLARPPEPPE